MPRPKKEISTRSVTVRLPLPLVEWLEAEATRREWSVTAVVVRVLERAGAPAVDDVTHGLPAAAVIPGRGAKRGGPVEGGGERAAMAPSGKTAGRPTPPRLEPVCDHQWKNMGWGIICEKCKVQR